MTDRVARIEARRQELGVTYEQLARMSERSLRTVYRVLKDRTSTSESALSAMEQALIWAKRGTSCMSPLRTMWRLALFLMAKDLGVPMSEVDAASADPKRKATNNPEWMRVAQVRRRAIYFLNTVFDYPQHELVAVSGLTPAGVSRICHEIEDERAEGGALDQRFDQLSRELMGGV